MMTCDSLDRDAVLVVVVVIVVVVVVVVVVVGGEPVPAVPPRAISPALHSELKHGQMVALTDIVTRNCS